jgi:hypothetical protein
MTTQHYDVIIGTGAGGLLERLGARRETADQPAPDRQVQEVAS